MRELRGGDWVQVPSGRLGRLIKQDPDDRERWLVRLSNDAPEDAISLPERLLRYVPRESPPPKSAPRLDADRCREARSESSRRSYARAMAQWRRMVTEGVG